MCTRATHRCHQNPPTFAQGFHGDYSGDKTRGTLFLTPDGSVRFFQVKESDGTVVFEHEITNDRLRLTAVVMTHDRSRAPDPALRALP
jgi:hypothetical protein